MSISQEIIRNTVVDEQTDTYSPQQVSGKKCNDTFANGVIAKNAFWN
jgi:hypothetical protein